MKCSGGRDDNYCASVFLREVGVGGLVSPVADRDSRDQERRSKHSDPVRLKGVARNGVGRFFEFGLSDVK